MMSSSSNNGNGASKGLHNPHCLRGAAGGDDVKRPSRRAEEETELVQSSKRQKNERVAKSDAVGDGADDAAPKKTLAAFKPDTAACSRQQLRTGRAEGQSEVFVLDGSDNEPEKLTQKKKEPKVIVLDGSDDELDKKDDPSSHDAPSTEEDTVLFRPTNTSSNRRAVNASNELTAVHNGEAIDLSVDSDDDDVGGSTDRSPRTTLKPSAEDRHLEAGAGDKQSDEFVGNGETIDLLSDFEDNVSSSTNGNHGNTLEAPKAKKPKLCERIAFQPLPEGELWNIAQQMKSMLTEPPPAEFEAFAIPKITPGDIMPLKNLPEHLQKHIASERGRFGGIARWAGMSLDERKAEHKRVTLLACGGTTQEDYLDEQRRRLGLEGMSAQEISDEMSRRSTMYWDNMEEEERRDAMSCRATKYWGSMEEEERRDQHKRLTLKSCGGTTEQEYKAEQSRRSKLSQQWEGMTAKERKAKSKQNALKSCGGTTEKEYQAEMKRRSNLQWEGMTVKERKAKAKQNALKSCGGTTEKEYQAEMKRRTNLRLAGKERKAKSKLTVAEISEIKSRNARKHSLEEYMDLLALHTSASDRAHIFELNSSGRLDAFVVKKKLHDLGRIYNKRFPDLKKVYQRRYAAEIVDEDLTDALTYNELDTLISSDGPKLLAGSGQPKEAFDGWLSARKKQWHQDAWRASKESTKRDEARAKVVRKEQKARKAAVANEQNEDTGRWSAKDTKAKTVATKKSAQKKRKREEVRFMKSKRCKPRCEHNRFRQMCTICGDQKV